MPKSSNNVLSTLNRIEAVQHSTNYDLETPQVEDNESADQVTSGRYIVGDTEKVCDLSKALGRKLAKPTRSECLSKSTLSS